MCLPFLCYLFHFIIQPWNCSMENTDKRQVKFTQTDQQLITRSVLWEAYLKLRSSGLLEAVEELLTVHQDLGQTGLGFQGVHPLSLHQLNLETKITLTVVHIIKPFEAYCKTRRACACVCMHVCVCAHACVCVRSCACTHRVCQMWPFSHAHGSVTFQRFRSYYEVKRWHKQACRWCLIQEDLSAGSTVQQS